jgi:hypothetical protein
VSINPTPSAEKRLSFQRFPMLVPSLPWQNDRRCVKMAAKRPVVFRTAGKAHREVAVVNRLLH